MSSDPFDRQARPVTITIVSDDEIDEVYAYRKIRKFVEAHLAPFAGAGLSEPIRGRTMTKEKFIVVLEPSKTQGMRSFGPFSSVDGALIWIKVAGEQGQIYHVVQLEIP